jgi:hypothetical protein
MSDEELKALLAAMTADIVRQVDAKIDAAVGEMSLHFEARINSTNDTMHSIADELHLHFDIATEESRVRFDQLGEAIATVDEKVVREVARLDEKIDRRFDDTQALIKFSHHDLDRRVRVLEKK